MLETDFGVMPYERGDYIILPRGTMYHFTPHTEDNFFLVIESFSEVDEPSKEMKGLLGQHALYDEGVIQTPEPAQPASNAEGQEFELRIKRFGDITKVFIPSTRST